MVTETQLKWTIEGELNPINKLLVNISKMLSKKVKEEIDLAFDNLYENNRYLVEWIGKACSYPGASRSATHCSWK